MYNKFKLSFILFFLLGAFSFSHAQTNHSITLNFDYLHVNNCFFEEVNGQESSWSGANVKMELTHNIGPIASSPDYPSNVDLAGWRQIFFDIFDVDAQGVETLEATITHTNSILSGAVPSGPFSFEYDIDVQDLISNNISAGQKKVKLRARMVLGNVTTTVDGFISDNGIVQCSAFPLDGNELICDIGEVDCFTYHPCDVDLNVFGWVTSVGQYDKYGNFIGYINEFHYNSTPIGGSGNFTYNWTSVGTPSASGSASYVFTHPSNNPFIYLRVEDNVTGCIYTFRAGFPKAVISEVGEELTLEAGPNPLSAGKQVTVKFNLPTEDSFELGIYDVNGKLMHDIPAQLSSHSGAHSIQMDPQLSAGIYIVRLITGAHGSKTSKLIVQ